MVAFLFLHEKDSRQKGYLPFRYSVYLSPSTDSLALWLLVRFMESSGRIWVERRSKRVGHVFPQFLL